MISITRTYSLHTSLAIGHPHHLPCVGLILDLNFSIWKKKSRCSSSRLTLPQKEKAEVRLLTSTDLTSKSAVDLWGDVGVLRLGVPVATVQVMNAPP